MKSWKWTTHEKWKISCSSYKKEQQQNLKKKKKKLGEDIFIRRGLEQSRRRNEINNIEAQLEEILHERPQFLIKQLEQGNYSKEVSSYLVNRLKMKKDKAGVTWILNPAGTITQDLQEI